jgi:hypothetical protein
LCYRDGRAPQLRFSILNSPSSSETGSARVSRAVFGVSPKTFHVTIKGIRHQVTSL